MPLGRNAFREEFEKQYLRGLLFELVKHAREGLEPDPDGKPKVFRNSLMKNISDFLDTFKFNLADDREVATPVNQMRRLATGVAPEDLRSDERLRETWAGELAKIEPSLSSMVIDRPSRQITFDD